MYTNFPTDITVYEPYSTPGVLCRTGWSDWQNLHQPDRKGEKESLEDLKYEELISCNLDQVSEIQCRDTKTLELIRHSGDNDIYCDLRTKGLECKNRNMPRGEKCSDFEIRAYCDCDIVPTLKPIAKVKPQVITQRSKFPSHNLYKFCCFFFTSLLQTSFPVISFVTMKIALTGGF